jgi:hypothetical protein
MMMMMTMTTMMGHECILEIVHWDLRGRTGKGKDSEG